MEGVSACAALSEILPVPRFVVESLMLPAA
jgi:hypothetical protein